MPKKPPFAVAPFCNSIILLLIANQSFATAPSNVNFQNKVTIGSYVNSDGGSVPLAYHGNGSTWELSNFPNPLLPTDGIIQSNTQSSFLNSVSCDILGYFCTAVGTYATTASLSNAPLAYTSLSYFSNNGGRDWSLSNNQNPLPLPKDVIMPASLQANALNGVTCGKLELINDHCISVGYYINNNKASSAPLIYTSDDRGENWSVVEPEYIQTTGSSKSKLYGAACYFSTANLNFNCVAVGSYINNDSTVPLSYYSTDGGASWTLNTNQPSVPDDLKNDDFNGLRSVSCNVLGTYCSAVGLYKNSNNGTSPLAYISTDGGINWERTPVTLPEDVIGTARLQNTVMNGVYCDFIGNCNAVGYYTNKLGAVAPAIYELSDYQWTPNQTPLPLPTKNLNTGLFSISCNPTKHLCNAVGYYNTTTNPLSYKSTDQGETWELNNDGLNLPTDAKTGRLNSIY